MRKISFRDIEWIFVIFGTAIGAGILFLPIQAAISGVISLTIASVFIIPVMYFSGFNIARIVLQEKSDYNITQIFNLKFNTSLALTSNIIYFLTCFTAIVAYAISLPKEVSDALVMFGLTKTALSNKMWFSFLVLAIPIVIMMTNKKIMLKIMSFVVYPLVVALFAVSVHLIPHWSIKNLDFGGSLFDIVRGLLMIFPILVFSMNFSQIISPFTMYYKKSCNDNSKAYEKVKNNIFLSTLLITFFTIFFIFSSLLSVNNHIVAEAAKQNLSIMDILSEHFKSGIWHYIVPIIPITAILSSFLGAFLGTLETFNEGTKWLLVKLEPSKANNLSQKTLSAISSVIIFFILWLIAISNIEIMSILGFLSAPSIAAFIFVVPFLYTIYTQKGFNLKRDLSLLVLLIIGIIVIFSYAMGLMM
ncbi:aromatic amino acid transport family protein [Hippea jasoniae]|uniref:aromatic amino acid transport family protein n=1 Tax=Hippea jasoniae TaxID=944479 RepID=UPI000552F16D|nr:aromatic amino acid transport family protein [Hippea jasoniae]